MSSCPLMIFYYTELMKKLRCLSKGEMVLKYQVVSEDLDALVSVKCEEDVGHMFDEINNWENAGGSMLRAFLFPTNPVMMENQMAVDPLLLEQRYVDAINGIIRSASRQHPNIIRHGSSSPSSPESCTTEVTYTENYHKSNMHRVQSLPNICTNAAQQHIIRKPALHLQRTEKVRSVGPRYHLDAAPLHYYSHASKKNRGMDL